MRVIKFRCWYDNQMQKVSCIDFQHKKIRLFASDTIDLHEGLLMQYTGLKDKNGKDIYEGDVVIHEFEDYLTKKTKKSYYLIEFKDCSFYLVFQENNDYGVIEKVYDDVLEEYYIRNWGLQVVGNIYENPELLEAI